MNHLLNILQAPLPCVASAKADGEFTLVRFKDNRIRTENVWKKFRSESELRALWELRDALINNNVKSATFKAELFWMEDEKPKQLPQFLHNKNNPNLTLGIFDLVEYNGALQDRIPYRDRLVTIENIILSDYYKRYPHRCAYKTLPYEPITSLERLTEVYNGWLKEGYEGMVLTDSSNTIYKLKPLVEIDAVIVGINTKGKLKHGEVTSIKTALINDQGRFVDLTDVASGIEVDLRRELYRLMDYRIPEASDEDTIRVQPLIVVTLGYQETFKATFKESFTYDPHLKIYNKAPLTINVSLRSPRLLRFRPDKTPTSRDVGFNQLPVDNDP